MNTNTTALSEVDTINFYRRPVTQLANMRTPVEVSGDMLAVMKQAAKPYTQPHVRHAAMSEAAEHRLDKVNAANV